jgi:3-hydroxymyristoyl/3-hydroxydecanoyl-(acyl carrier protein) dehydratase
LTVVWFSEQAATAAAGWPWAGFTPAQAGADSDGDVGQSRFSLISAAPFLAGHFPGRPILPGVAIIDAAVMACRSAAGSEKLRLRAISGARFLSTVLPGDDLTLRATRLAAGAWRVTASAAGVLCARMTLHVTDEDHAPRRAATPWTRRFDLGPADIALRLPQRAPMLMLEGAIRLSDGTWDVHGRPHLPGAGFGDTVSGYPESLICEGFFQAAGIALESDIPEGAMLLLGSVGRADFGACPHASEAVRHIVTSCRMLGSAASVAGETRTLDDVLVASYADVLVVVRAADTPAAKTPQEFS